MFFIKNLYFLNTIIVFTLLVNKGDCMSISATNNYSNHLNNQKELPTISFKLKTSEHTGLKYRINSLLSKIASIPKNLANIIAKAKTTPQINSFTPIDLNQKAKPLTSTHPIEKLAEKVRGGIHRNWGKGLISQEVAIQKMKKNLMKAQNEHVDSFQKNNPRCGPKSISNPYEISKQPEHPTNTRELKCLSAYAEAQGPRPSMEDAHFSISLRGGTLVGVLDGHGGKAVADYASQRFQNLFPPLLEKHNGNVHQAFEEVFSLINAEIIKNRKYDHIGSTAVICYIERSTNCVYTATLGDSEANIYRKINCRYKSIPLSCVRDWSCTRDEQRAAQATQMEYREPIVEYWHNKNLSSKDRRVAPKFSALILQNVGLVGGVNVSRAFGDQANNIGRPFDAVIAKPKITMFNLEPEDILILACDGLKDYVEEDSVIECIGKNASKTPQVISKNLVKLAIDNSAWDNVTVVALKIN